MSKDFAVSYEQRKWAMAVHFHTKYTNMLKTTVSTKFKSMCEDRINEYEKQYPQLKQK